MIALLLLCALFWGGKGADICSAEELDFVRFTLAGNDSLHVLNRKIKSGETLANILLSHRVPYRAISKIERASREIFDLRSLRAGNSYFVINELDSADRINYLVYERNLTEYVVFKLDEPVDVYLGEKHVEIVEKTVSGTIESTLFDALSANPLSYELAHRVTELFAYQIDFYHLQKGDFFKAVYTEKHIGNEAAACDRILAMRFNHRKRDYYAFYYDRQGGGSYYDENGNSLEKSFLKAPLTYAVVSSPYQKKRLHPIHNRYIPHLGIDYAAPTGTPVMSVGDGSVKQAEYQREMGNYITISHNNIYSTQYLHLSRFARGIGPGVSVKRGDIIGYVGSTGTATGPHVEYRLYKYGRPIDPQKEEMPSAEPLKAQHVKAFRQIIADYKQSLNQIVLSKRANKQTLAVR